MENQHQNFTKPMWQQKRALIGPVVSIKENHTEFNPKQALSTGLLLGKEQDKNGAGMIDSLKSPIEKALLLSISQRIIENYDPNVNNLVNNSILFFASEKLYDIALKERLSKINPDERLGKLITDLLVNSIYTQQKPSLNDLIKFSSVEIGQPILNDYFQ